MHNHYGVTLVSHGRQLATGLALGLATVLIVALGASATSPLPSPQLRLPDPYGPAVNGAMAYEVNGDIYLADADGANPRPIITGDTIDKYPWFSQDGTHIGFMRGPDSDQALMVADADGTHVSDLWHRDFWWASFMPASAHMVVSRMVDGHSELSLIDVPSSGVVEDISVGDIELRGWVEARPPDGRELVFTGHPQSGVKDLAIYTIGSDGSGLRTVGPVSTTESGDETSPATQISFQDPALAPDGSTIAYWNWESKGSGPADGYLHLRDMASGLELPAPSDPVDHGGVLPQFSPDGTSLLFEGNGPTQNLFYGPIDGSSPARAIGPTYSYLDRQSFSFSPDGTKVILVESGKVSLIDVATGETTVLAGIPTGPSWQRLAP